MNYSYNIYLGILDSGYHPENIFVCGDSAGTANKKTPLISSVYDDFTEFPPIHIQNGGHEVLLSDSKWIVEKAKSANVDVHFEIIEGCCHDRYLYVGLLSSSNQIVYRMGNFIKKNFIGNQVNGN